jgi:hypothetical protein
MENRKTPVVCSRKDLHDSAEAAVGISAAATGMALAAAQGHVAHVVDFAIRSRAADPTSMDLFWSGALCACRLIEERLRDEERKAAAAAPAPTPASLEH